MNSELTQREKDVLNAMAVLHINTEWLTSTKIGMKCGKTYDAASSWGSSILKKLVAKGLVLKEKGGKYKIKGQ